jgi:hypothetical protein
VRKALERGEPDRAAISVNFCDLLQFHPASLPCEYLSFSWFDMSFWRCNMVLTQV